MMSPAMSMAIFTSIAKQEGFEVKLFETTHYSSNYVNKQIRMAETGATRNTPNSTIYHIKNPDDIIPDLIDTVERYNPDLIMFSIQEDVWRVATDMLDAIKKFDIPTIIGGQFPTHSPNIAISHPSVNIIALHEGEEIVKSALLAIKENTSIFDIPGIWYKKEDTVYKNKPASLVDINQITPDYSCYSDTRWRRPMGGKVFERAVSMETYRGCPYNCTYCNSPTTRNIAREFNVGNFMRRKDVSTIENELKHYINIYNPDLIFFVDDSFLARPAQEIFDFCDMWEKYKIPFWMNTRIENCKPEYLKRLKEVGLYRMNLGIESGNEKYRRDVLKRNADNETYLKSLQHINESNIPYCLNVIIGMPYETRDMVLDTARFVHQARGYDSITLAMFQPYWGTELRTLAVKAGFLDNNHINGFNSRDTFGGLLDTWSLNMPEPYLQYHEVKQLIKTFALYAYYDESMWGEIQRAEVDDVLFERMLEQYKKEFYVEFQEGGIERIARLQKYCPHHDATSTFYYEEVK